MAATDIELLSNCVNFILFHTHEAEEKVIKELQTSAATPLVSALRMFRLQRAVLAIGMFSLFESLLQDRLGWKDPFKQANEYLKKCRKEELAATFSDFAMAINVLKHGEGRSYESLVQRASKLDFSIKQKDQASFSEGDVSEVGVLIDANDAFVKRCATLIQEVADVIRSKEQTWI